MASCGEDEAPSYVHAAGVFVKDNVAVSGSGVVLKDAARSFAVDQDSLDLGPVLGSGASSYVQFATHRPTGTPLALKVLNLYDKSKRAQLVREIQALYDADCDCLVSFFGAFARDGAITIALEYCNCGTLCRVQALASGRRFPEPVLAGIAFQMLWALAYMRVDKRLHRDVKPSNVLVNSEGVVKLSDFGLSAELQNSILMAATFVGTCRYMAPERIRHEPYAFASDVWSFGLVLLECALGRFPYPDAATYIEMAELIVDSAEPRVPDGEGFSRELAQVVAACLVRRPEDRLPADILMGELPFGSAAGG